MSSDRFSQTERILKWGAFLVAVATLGWGVYQYFDGRAHDREIRQLEATAPFLEKQLTLYSDVMQVAAAIASLEDSQERTNAISRFSILQYGDMTLVQDLHVEAAMHAFASAIANQAPRAELLRLSQVLARQCRESLARSWKVDLWRDPEMALEAEKLQLLMGD